MVTCNVTTSGMSGIEKILTEAGSGLCYLMDSLQTTLPEWIVLLGVAGAIVSLLLAIAYLIKTKVSA